MNACTIIARNYLPYARVLADSFLSNHPGGRFTTLVLDLGPGESLESDEPFGSIGPYDIGIERHEVDRMAMIYDVKELATAVKPALLQTLLADDDHAVYFDPDIQVFRPLDDIAQLAREHSIVLTPHATRPLPRDDRLPDEKMIMQAGTFNLGFVAVGNGASEFLDWWRQRLRRDCIVAVERALFVDQRWVDWVPSLFEHTVLRDVGCNVAYWNLHYRTIDRAETGWTVNGAPLRFFHFSGYTPRARDAVSAHMGGIPRIVLSERPDIQPLFADYADELERKGFGAHTRARYRFDTLPSGTRVVQDMRRLYRHALLAAERGDGPEPPDPFDPATEDEFLAWLNEPVVGAERMTRYLHAVYSRRADLQAAFPNLSGGDAAAFLRWVRTSGFVEEDIPEALAPPVAEESAQAVVARVETQLRHIVRRHPSLRVARPAWDAVARRASRAAAENGAGEPVVDVPAVPLPGANVVGYLRAELGIAEVARQLTAACARAGIAYSAVPYSRTLSRQEHPVELPARPRAPYDVNIVCINADQLPVFAADAGRDFFANRTTVGVWFWEVSEFPAQFRSAFAFVDEIWVASEFVANAVRGASQSKPVLRFPVPVQPRPAPELPRAALGLDDAYTFLFSFDFLSVFERKNPLGVVDAFTRAFEPGEGPRLVLKSINGDHDPASAARLRAAIAARPDITFIDAYVSVGERDALTASCDCYVSLHRSEGFGLTMAEAMAYGKPVIATGYSGNLDFMTNENSYLVAYRPRLVGMGQRPYPPTAEWAEPDVAHAAKLMRYVHDNPDEAARVARRARRQILARRSVEHCAAFVASRVAALEAGRAA
jgi:glycosyltransferase involved in cell wall biosynthesis